MVIPVILFQECVKHPGWAVQSDEPWCTSQGGTLDEAIANFGQMLVVQKQFELAHDQKETPCPSRFEKASILALSTTEFFREVTVNEVGLAHATLRFYVDKRELDPDQPCRCISMERFLEALNKHGAKISYG